MRARLRPDEREHVAVVAVHRGERRATLQIKRAQLAVPASGRQHVAVQRHARDRIVVLEGVH
eukprot:5240730-Prymnesium_polylepis.1